MINKITSININSIPFTGKKKPIKKQSAEHKNCVYIEDSTSLIDKFASTIVLKPSLSSQALKSAAKDYKEAYDLISAYNEKYDEVEESNSIAKANFMHYKRTMQYWYDYANNKARLAQKNNNKNETINKDYQATINRKNLKTFIQYDKNLSPLYVVVKDFEGDTIFDFENNLVMKNYKKDKNTGTITIDEVHVFDAFKSGNIYSDISRSMSRKISLFDVVQKSENSLNASALLTYCRGHKNDSTRLFLKNTYTNPKILYFQTDDSILVKSDYKATIDDDDTMSELISKDKAIFKYGLEIASKNNSGKLFQMYNIGSKINYARLVPPRHSSLSECYVKLFD